MSVLGRHCLEEDFVPLAKRGNNNNNETEYGDIINSACRGNDLMLTLFFGRDVRLCKHTR